MAASSFSQAHKSQFLNLEVLSPKIRGEIGVDSPRLEDKLLSPTWFLVQPIYTTSLAPCLLTSEMRVMFSRERARAVGSVLAEVQDQLSLGQAQCSLTASPYSRVWHLASELSTLAVFSEDIVPSPFDVWVQLLGLYSNRERGHFNALRCNLEHLGSSVFLKLDRHPTWNKSYNPTSSRITCTLNSYPDLQPRGEAPKWEADPRLSCTVSASTPLCLTSYLGNGDKIVCSHKM